MEQSFNSEMATTTESRFSNGFWIPTLKAAPPGFSPTNRMLPPKLIIALVTPLDNRKSLTRSAI